MAYPDSTHTKVHQHDNGDRERKAEATGSSRGGLNKKNHAVSDALLRLAAKIRLTPGNVSDHPVAPELTGELRDCAVVEDKGYHSRKNRAALRAQGCEPCIPSRRTTKTPEPYDEQRYRSRHCIENFFQRIKVFRRVATRCEKTKRMFLAMLVSSVSATYEQFGLWNPM